MDNRVDNATGTVLLRATVGEPDGFIKPGLFGVVAMPATKPYQGILLPDEAVSANQDKAHRLRRGRGRHGGPARGEARTEGRWLPGDPREGLKGDENVVVERRHPRAARCKVTAEASTLPPSKT